VGEIYAHYKAGVQRLLLVAATGSGKTSMAVRIIGDCATVKTTSDGRTTGGKVVWFCVSINVLVDQTYKALLSIGLNPTDVGFVASGYKENVTANVQIVSLQTLATPKRAAWFSRLPHLVILDEAHTTTWTTIARKLQDAVIADGGKVLGLTATPNRLSKRQSFADYYDRCVLAPSMVDLTEQGFLSPITYKALASPDLSQVKTKGGDFDGAELSRVCDTDEAIASALDGWQAHGLGLRTIAFTTSVAHATLVAEAFNLRYAYLGYRAAVVTGDTSLKDRDVLFATLASGDLTLIASCNALSTGFDCPAVEVGMLLRPTKSIALHVQQIGRVARVSVNKTKALILDSAGNVERLGFPEDLSEALCEDVILASADAIKAGPPPTKACPECGTILRISLRDCPDCGYHFESSPTERKTAVGTFVELPRVNKASWDDHQYRDYYRALRIRCWHENAPTTNAYGTYVRQAETQGFPEHVRVPGRGWALNSIWADPTPADAMAFLNRLWGWQKLSSKDARWMQAEFNREFGSRYDFVAFLAEYKARISRRQSSTTLDVAS
jgi:superfamily II DNA or RNA helicase